MRARLAGDELVARPMWRSTRAITIPAPREDVWPWIVQMGFPTHRAGWYTPHWLDRLMWHITARSADRIVPELQSREDPELGHDGSTNALIRRYRELRD